MEMRPSIGNQSSLPPSPRNFGSQTANYFDIRFKVARGVKLTGVVKLAGGVMVAGGVKVPRGAKVASIVYSLNNHMWLVQ